MQTGDRSASDLSAIQSLVARARLRIRGQWALEGAVTATVLAAAAAAAIIFAMRLGAVSPGIAVGLLVGTGSIILAGALLKALRPLDDETVARRIDRASNLSDRLSTAIAFRHAATAEDGETADLMAAAIRDGVRAAPRANVKAAAPFTAPRDLRAALGFLAISALAAGLALPSTDTSPHLYFAAPDHGPPGIEVTLHGDHLLTGVTAAVAAPAAFIPDGGAVYLAGEAGAGGRPLEILDWTRSTITVRIPADAPIGPAQLSAHLGSRKVGPIAFLVVDPKDDRFHKADAVALDPDERAYVEAILAELRALAKRENIAELEKFADTIEQLLKDAEEGKITKEQLLDALSKAEDLLNQGKEPDQAQLDKQLGELGKELAKSELTKELGEALEKNDLEKAKQELEELAAKLDPEEMAKQKEELEKALQDPTKTEEEKRELQKQLDQLKAEKPMTEKQKEELQKQLEQTAQKMQEQQKQQAKQQEQQTQKLQDEMKRLQKQKEEAKTEEEKLSAERQLQKKQDELKKLDKDDQDKNQSAQRDAVKRLQRDLEKAAESLDKPKDQQESQQEQQEREKQASQKLKDAARETGKVDQDQRKQAQQKKLSSQMDDLREAMRRAKQKGNKGPNDPFNKKGKNQDYASRSRGQKGNGGQAWKPGQGNQPGQGGQGQGQPGGQGKQPGQGDQWGVGHDPNLTGDATGKSGNTKDQDLQGESGKDGGSTRETILSAAQKGFASKRYQKVYADYQRIVEEVMRTEKLPSSYKYYVKRYFAKIHPSGAPPASTETPGAQGTP